MSHMFLTGTRVISIGTVMVSYVIQTLVAVAPNVFKNKKNNLHLAGDGGTHLYQKLKKLVDN